MREVFLLAVTASINPTLLTGTTVMLLLPNPRRLMAGYLLGAYFVSITLGLVIVFALPNSGAADTTQHTLGPAVEIALGSLALVAAFILHSGRHEQTLERRRARKRAEGGGPPRWQRTLSKGTPQATFVIGMLLTLPGASYLAGLNRIHKLDYSTPGTVLLVVGFNVVMLWLLEVPLVSYIVAPKRTPAAIERMKASISRNGITFAVRGLAVVGTLLVLKGIITLLS
jgi:hypothetical protein